MDIEKLTKSQVILLTLLTSFVTSIATGIVTVSLMDQAPPQIAQSVSRIIERTIETVASSTPKGQAAASIITQQKTVVVKESDLISQAVAVITPSIVRLYADAQQDPAFLGFGIVVDPSGVIVADTGEFGDAPDAVVVMQDGARVRAFVTARNSDEGIAHLTAATTTLDGAPPVWKAVAISTDHPVLGESVVSIAGKTATRIGQGIVTALTGGDSSPMVIDTDITDGAVMFGSALFRTDGTLLGVSTEVSRASSPTGFVSAAALVDAPQAKK